MRILFGIGNPGTEYFLNRHNAGFMFLDYFAVNHSLNFKPSKFDYYFAKGSISGSSYILIKPTTFVNNSGIAALQAYKKFEIEINDFLVVYDDFNLEISTLRLRLSGGDGGHNGLSSIIYHLNSNQFPRLRIGIGNNFKSAEMVDYVLGDFDEEEQKTLAETFKTGNNLLEEFIIGGVDKMLDANSKLKKDLKKDNDN